MMKEKKLWLMEVKGLPSARRLFPSWEKAQEFIESGKLADLIGFLTLGCDYSLRGYKASWPCMVDGFAPEWVLTLKVAKCRDCGCGDWFDPASYEFHEKEFIRIYKAFLSEVSFG